MKTLICTAAWLVLAGSAQAQLCSGSDDAAIAEQLVVSVDKIQKIKSKYRLDSRQLCQLAPAKYLEYAYSADAPSPLEAAPAYNQLRYAERANELGEVDALTLRRANQQREALIAARASTPITLEPWDFAAAQVWRQVQALYQCETGPLLAGTQQSGVFAYSGANWNLVRQTANGSDYNFGPFTISQMISGINRCGPLLLNTGFRFLRSSGAGFQAVDNWSEDGIGLLRQSGLDLVKIPAAAITRLIQPASDDNFASTPQRNERFAIQQRSATDSKDVLLKIAATAATAWAERSTSIAAESAQPYTGALAPCPLLDGFELPDFGSTLAPLVRQVVAADACGHVFIYWQKDDKTLSLPLGTLHQPHSVTAFFPGHRFWSPSIRIAKYGSEHLLAVANVENCGDTCYYEKQVFVCRQCLATLNANGDATKIKRWTNNLSGSWVRIATLDRFDERYALANVLLLYAGDTQAIIGGYDLWRLDLQNGFTGIRISDGEKAAFPISNVAPTTSNLPHGQYDLQLSGNLLRVATQRGVFAAQSLDSNTVWAADSTGLATPTILSVMGASQAGKPPLVFAGVQGIGTLRLQKTAGGTIDASYVVGGEGGPLVMRKRTAAGTAPTLAAAHYLVGLLPRLTPYRKYFDPDASLPNVWPPDTGIRQNLAPNQPAYFSPYALAEFPGFGPWLVSGSSELWIGLNLFNDWNSDPGQNPQWLRVLVKDAINCQSGNQSNGLRSGETITAIAAADNALWIGTSGGRIGGINLAPGALTICNSLDSGQFAVGFRWLNSSPTRVNRLLCPKNSGRCFAAHAGDVNGSRLRRFAAVPTATVAETESCANASCKQSIYALAYYGNQLYFGTDSGLYVWDSKNSANPVQAVTFQTASLPGNSQIRDIQILDDGTMILGTNVGVWVGKVN